MALRPLPGRNQSIPLLAGLDHGPGLTTLSRIERGISDAAFCTKVSTAALIGPVAMLFGFG